MKSFSTRLSMALLTLMGFGISTFGVLHAQRTILHCGRLLNAANNALIPEMSVIVEGNRITGVEKGYLSGDAEDQIIDLKAHSVLPGLTDMHVHIEGESSPTRYQRRAGTAIYDRGDRSHRTNS